MDSQGLSVGATKALPDLLWTDDGAYSWPKDEELVKHITKMLELRAWPDTYRCKPLRVDRLLSLLYDCEKPSVYGTRLCLAEYACVWTTVRDIDEKSLVWWEMMPVLWSLSSVTLQFSVKAEGKYYKVAVDGEVLQGIIHNWVVLPKGSGSAKVETETGEIVLLQFLTQDLASNPTLINNPALAR